MAAIIDYEIEERSFEKIRDRVGLILAAELTNQYSLTYDELFDVGVYVQRTRPVQPEECPMINISVDSGTYDNQTVIDSDGTFRILIHVFTKAESTVTTQGDIAASKDAQRLAGVCQAILSNPRYVTLLFNRPFIMRSKIDSFGSGVIDKGEATNLAVVETVLTVKAAENERGSDPVALAEISTMVQLYNTGNGYLYSGTPIEPTPGPICAPVTYQITDEDGNDLQSGTVESGFNLAYEVQNAIAALKNSAGAVISTTEILAEQSEDIAAPDATYSVEYENGTVIEAGNIVSGGAKVVEVPNPITCVDGTAVLKDSDGNTLSSTPVPSGNPVNITAPDATYSNSDNTFTGSVLSGGSLSIPDSQINVNSVDQGDVVSVKTIDVNITDGTDPVTPDSVSLVGNTLTIAVPAGGVAPVGAMPLKTGQTVSYATGDDGDLERGRPLFTLPVVNAVQTLNHFGHKWALTGVTGGYYDYDTLQYKDVNGVVTTRDLAFPNYLLCDFRSQDVNGDFFMWSLSSSWIGVGSLDFTTAKTTADSLTVAGFSNFKVPNFNEIMFSFWMNNDNMIVPIESAYPNTPPTVVFNSNSTDVLNTANNIGFWIGGANRKTLIYFPKAATNPIVNYCFLRITNVSEL